MSLPQFTSHATAEEVGASLREEMSGKNVLLTGTSMNGIGFEIARVLAQHVDILYIAGHNSERLKLVEESLKREAPFTDIRPLSSISPPSPPSAKPQPKSIRTPNHFMHVIIHNAAAPIGPFKLTTDGLESQIATDHIGPFLLTKLLTAKLLSGATATYTPRVILTSSVSAVLGAGVDFAIIGRADPENYHPVNAYFQAKAAAALQAIALSKRSGGKINAYSVHPGAVFTNLMQHEESLESLKQIGLLDADGQPTQPEQYKSISHGAATTLVAAFDRTLNGHPGAYLSDCKIANDQLPAACSSVENAERLWTLTEELIGEEFVF
ncbi:hypothetical protein FB45DRAFT_1053371 [Roridomyces roridus]|uniref:NAD(P)-binding protein n=1 Tax=Roridomyces roridus TaxID=1738132 RepID=A0AAD7CC01_9AGAR|nr:hypothetical protein FB45DRAFT_1053371 [Roridomyces roridus]